MSTIQQRFVLAASLSWLYAFPVAAQDRLPDMRTENVAAMAVAGDGLTVATGERTSLINVWDVRSRAVQRRLRAHTAQISALAFSPDGSTLASGSYDPVIRIWDVRSGEEKLAFDDHPGHVKSLAWSNDGRFLASTGADGIRVWDVETGKLRTMMATSRGTVTAVFSPDAKTLASAGGNGLLLWNVETGKVIRDLSPSRDGLILALAFSPDGRLLAGGGTGRNVRLWDTSSGELQATSGTVGDVVRGVAFRGDGRALVMIDRRGAHLWLHEKGESRPLTAPSAFSAVAVSGNARLIAAARGGNQVTVWSVKPRSRLQR